MSRVSRSSVVKLYMSYYIDWIVEDMVLDCTNYFPRHGDLVVLQALPVSDLPHFFKVVRYIRRGDYLSSIAKDIYEQNNCVVYRLS